jgi:D-lactate dehydrogenase
MKRINIKVFSTKFHDILYFNRLNVNNKFDFNYITHQLNKTNLPLFNDLKMFDNQNCKIISTFVNDTVDAECLTYLKDRGVSTIACRSNGYNNIDIKKADELNMTVVNVPAYSPYSVAEHAMALTLSVHRKIPLILEHIKKQNFSLDGLLSTDLHGKTVGIIGSGKIGLAYANICHGMGLNIIYHSIDPCEEFEKMGAKFVSLQKIYQESDIISLHIPLNQKTHYIINTDSINQMKKKPLIINTSRGGLICTDSIIKALEENKISGLGIDVYENEANLFYGHLEHEMINDTKLAKLWSFDNVIITNHIGFFTEEALNGIYETTMDNIQRILNGKTCTNIVNNPIYTNKQQ